jgi:hypothetical protein
VGLSDEQRREVVALLADLLLAAEARQGGARSAGVIDGASDGAIGSVIPFPQERARGVARPTSPPSPTGSRTSSPAATQSRPRRYSACS